ncbi:MAG: SDR family oxidoreductase [Rhodospirillaceae bacterium]
MRLKDKVAVVVGGGQQPGETMGNGRATCIRFAQEGAKVLVVDFDLGRAEETVKMIGEAGGTASALAADIVKETDCIAIAKTCVDRYGRIDILHNNVGRSRGDKGTVEMDADMWDELFELNLKAMFMTIKHVLPIMRKQGSGSIINISSTSSLCARGTIAYKTSKGAINTMTHMLAQENAPWGIRVNVIIPGLMDTPMAIERRAQERGIDRKVVRDERNAQVLLGSNLQGGGKMGTAWDVANAALFLASDEAGYITGQQLAVDGGISTRIG